MSNDDEGSQSDSSEGSILELLGEGAGARAADPAVAAVLGDVEGALDTLVNTAQPVRLDRDGVLLPMMTHLANVFERAEARHAMVYGDGEDHSESAVQDLVDCVMDYPDVVSVWMHMAAHFHAAGDTPMLVLTLRCLAALRSFPFSQTLVGEDAYAALLLQLVSPVPVSATSVPASSAPTASAASSTTPTAPPPAKMLRGADLARSPSPSPSPAPGPGPAPRRTTLHDLAPSALRTFATMALATYSFNTDYVQLSTLVERDVAVPVARRFREYSAAITSADLDAFCPADAPLACPAHIGPFDRAREVAAAIAAQERIDRHSRRPRHHNNSDDDEGEEEQQEQGEQEQEQQEQQEEEENEPGPAVITTEPLEDVKAEDLDEHMLAALELRALLELIAVLGEYQEVLPVLIQERVFDFLLVLLKSSNDYFLADVLECVGSLLKHMKFGTMFVERGGVQALYAIARSRGFDAAFPSRSSNSSSTSSNNNSTPNTINCSVEFLGPQLGQCLERLAAHANVTEQVCLMPNPYPGFLVRLGLTLLASHAAMARRCALQFFAGTLSFRAVLGLFDGARGLAQVVALLRAQDPDGAAPLLGALLRCLRQYFRTHYVLFAQALRARDGAAALDAAPPGYKAVDIGAAAIFDADRVLDDHNRRGAGAALRAGRWAPAAAFLDHGGLRLLLQYAAAGVEEAAAPEDVPALSAALEVVGAATLPARGQAELLAFVSDDDQHKTGVAVLADLLSKKHAALLVPTLTIIANCVCRPVKKPSQQQQQAIDAASGSSSSSQTAAAAASAAAAPQATATTTGGGGNVGNGSDSQNPSVTVTTATTAATGPNVNDLLRDTWKALREVNCTQRLLQLLKYREDAAQADAVRALACKALAGLARDSTLCQILGKLDIVSPLTELLRAPVSVDGARYHALLREHAVELVGRTAGPGAAASLKDAAAGTVQSRAAHAAVVARTVVTYDRAQLLELIRDHLAACGLSESAATLSREAGLPVAPPVPIASTSATTPSATPNNSSSNNTLHSMVVQYLRNQHEHCATPIAVLPPFDLRHTHRCPTTTVAAALAQCGGSHATALTARGRAPISVAARLLDRQQQCAPYRSSGGRHLDYRLCYSRCTPGRLVAEKGSIASNGGGGENGNGGNGNGNGNNGSNGNGIGNGNGVANQINTDEDEDHFLTCACFYRGRRELLLGTAAGEARLVHTQTSRVLQSWQMFDGMVGRLAVSADARWLVASSVPEDEAAGDDACATKVWDLGGGVDAPGAREPCQVFGGVYAAALSAVPGSDRVLGTLARRLAVYSLETGQVVRTMEGSLSWAQKRVPGALESGARWSPCEDLVLNDNVLWDPRAPRVLHAFDKLTAASVPSGYFSPGGTEVIINQGIWDLRTFKLVRTCPYFQYAALTFSRDGRAVYAVPRRRPPRRVHSSYYFDPFQPLFHIVDAADYSLITEARTGGPVWALAADPTDAALAVIEGDPYDPAEDSHCHLYFLGSHDPAEPDTRDSDDDADDASDADDDDDSSIGSLLSGSDSDSESDSDSDSDDDDGFSSGEDDSDGSTEYIDVDDLSEASSVGSDDSGVMFIDDLSDRGNWRALASDEEIPLEDSDDGDENERHQQQRHHHHAARSQGRRRRTSHIEFEEEPVSSPDQNQQEGQHEGQERQDTDQHSPPSNN